MKRVRHEDDGDVHFDLAVDPPYARLLTPANSADQHGDLVVEIVPADEPGCTPGQPPRPATGTYDYGICTGADETPPAIGSHVAVTGPYVLDEDHHGWAEVHPVWAISTASPSTTTTLPPTATTTTTVPPPAPTTAPPPITAAPVTSPPPSTGCYIDPEGNCYRAGEYCPAALRGQTVQGSSGPITCEDNDGWRWEPA